MGFDLRMFSVSISAASMGTHILPLNKIWIMCCPNKVKSLCGELADNSLLMKKKCNNRCPISFGLDDYGGHMFFPWRLNVTI
jgi:hypothetical protein